LSSAQQRPIHIIVRAKKYALSIKLRAPLAKKKKIAESFDFYDKKAANPLHFEEPDRC
jgi:hypothetical protein